MDGLGLASTSRGHAFAAWLPLPLSETKRLDPSECAPKNAEDIVLPHRVLVIEDHADTADAIASCLRYAGHAVTVAATGEEGLELAHRTLPHVIFCDIWLPGVDGYYVARALKSDAWLADCYLVAVSGVPFRAGHGATFNEYMRKPVDAEALLAAMKRAATPDA